MDEILLQLNSYLEAAAKVIGQVAPQVWDYTLIIIRLEGLLNLTWGLLCATVIAVYYTKFFGKWGAWCKECEDVGGAYVARAILSGGATVAFAAGCIINVLNLNTWLSIFWPQASIIYRIGEKAGVF